MEGGMKYAGGRFYCAEDGSVFHGAIPFLKDKAESRYLTLGQLVPKLPGWGGNPNKQKARFSTGGKSRFRANGKPVALFAP